MRQPARNMDDVRKLWRNTELRKQEDRQHIEFVGVAGDGSQETYHSTDLDGKVIPDSGCKRSVAGQKWHRRMKQSLAKEGLQPIEIEIDEQFRFGDGKVLNSKRS